ncbi:MAG: hypothetical protein ACQER9_00945 [Nanobdellota archaeon]
MVQEIIIPENKEGIKRIHQLKTKPNDFNLNRDDFPEMPGLNLDNIIIQVSDNINEDERKLISTEATKDIHAALANVSSVEPSYLFKKGVFIGVKYDKDNPVLLTTNMDLFDGGVGTGLNALYGTDIILLDKDKDYWNNIVDLSYRACKKNYQDIKD